MALRSFWQGLAAVLFCLGLVNIGVYQYLINNHILTWAPWASVRYCGSLNSNTTHSMAAVDRPTLTPDSLGYVILPPDPCGGRDVELLLCVPVSRGNAAGRKVVRETWGSYSKTGIGGGRRVERDESATTSTTAHNSDGTKNTRTAHDVGSLAFEKTYNIVLVFFVGSSASLNSSREDQKAIEKEAGTFGDIVQADFVDTYNNLSLKSVSALKWVSTYCSQAKYVAKIDDDMYVNVPLLLHTLHARTNSLMQKASPSNLPPPLYPSSSTSFSPTSSRSSSFDSSSSSSSIPPAYSPSSSSSNTANTLKAPPSESITRESNPIPDYIIGNAQLKSPPIRDKASKYYTSCETYSGDVYPSYTLGGASYAMTGLAARRLYTAALRVPVYWLEDVYITGMCAAHANLLVLNDDRFADWDSKVSSCQFRQKISGHKYSKEEIRQIHYELTSPYLKCPSTASSASKLSFWFWR